MGVEAFGGYLRVPRINPYLPARVEFIGNNTGQASSKDIGKPVKLAGETTALCASGDEIFGFIESVEVGTNNGYSYGGVLSDIGHEVIAKDEVGNLAVGDLVVAGTPIALGTQTPKGGYNVKKAQATSDNAVLTAGGLVIKQAEAVVAKTVNTIQAVIGGVAVTKTAGDMPALVGTIAAGKYNVFCFLLDGAGVVTTAIGTAGDSASQVVFPTVPANKVMIGYVLITSTAEFTGGTTKLDAAGVTATYVDLNTPMGSAAPKHRWQVMARYTTGTYAGSVMLRKV
ncbi:hypothetical protein [uncultured Halomonas sp.]|uniref:hypothetical protein n=1 Tax=uncultured Halomonas sp. TaxID=173971 RepID=UPI002622FB9E|nr:hypothetical protein [uncultured Halomonas sp.]